MANRLDHLALLQAVVRQSYNCEAVHSQTVPVHEMMEGKTIWEGEVEVFDLCGNTKAKKCYAWLQHQPDKSLKYVVVPENHSVNSPELAVQSAIFFDVQPTPYSRLNPSS